jgi:molybdenum cofactor cytidylyltransferase
MTLAIVPAAGASRRMGRPKLLLPYGTSTIVGSLASALRAGGASPVVIVAAPGDTELQEHARSLGALVVVNPDPERGMLSSIREGLAALGGADRLAQRGEVVLVAPADLPALRPGTVAELLWRRAAAGAPLAVPAFQGQRGHPLAIAPELLAEIDVLDQAIGLKQLLERHAAAALEVPVDDPGAVRDIDTPEDYQELSPASTPG